MLFMTLYDKVLALQNPGPDICSTVCSKLPHPSQRGCPYSQSAVRHYSAHPAGLPRQLHVHALNTFFNSDKLQKYKLSDVALPIYTL